MEIMIHPQVQRYIIESGEKERLIKNIKRLIDDSYNSRSGVDIKKLKGKKHEMYRLRVGDHGFECFIDEGKVWVDNAFKR